MATLPIHLEVEAEAVGPVMIALRKMPGVIKMHLDLGEGPGSIAAPRGARTNPRAGILQLLTDRKGGPLSLQEILTETGLAKKQAYGTLHHLKKQGVLRSVEPGVYQFTDKAMAAAGLTLALPKPAKSHNKSHKKAKGNGHAAPIERASPGATTAALKAILADGPMRPREIASALAAHGISPRGASGVLHRGRLSGLIKKTGDVYALTAKAKRAEPVVAPPTAPEA
jgi:hypothetical protein